MPSKMRPFLLVFLICLLATPLALAQAGPLVTVRLSSFDAGVDDVTRAAQAMGQEFDGNQLLAGFGKELGAAFSLMDTKRPMGLVIPMQGITMGEKGMVLLLPVTDTEAVLAKLAERAQGVTDGADGSKAFSFSETDVMHVMPHDGYLVAAAEPMMLSGVDLGAFVAGGALPAGNLALDVDLEQIAPFIMMQLATAKEMAKQQIMAGGAAAGGETAPQDEAAPQAPEGGAPDMAAVGPMIDFYFDLLNDMLMNVSRLQVSLEMREPHLILHQRLVPKAGSTLAGFVAAQDTEMTPLAQHLPAEAVAHVVSTMTLTPESRAAYDSYVTGYANTMNALLEQSAEFAPFAALMDEFGPGSELFQTSLACMSGEMAIAYDLGESGINVRQLTRLGDGEGCGGLVQLMGNAMKSLGTVKGSSIPVGWESVPVADVQGVPAYRMDVFFGKELTEGDEGQVIAKLFGGEKVSAYFGQREQVLVSAFGATAEEDFGKLVGGLSGSGSGGVAASDFAPFEAGAGIYGRVDLPRLFDAIASLETESDADLEELRAALAAGGGSIAFALAFEGGHAQSSFAIPLDVVARIAPLLENEQEEHHHDHDHGHDHDHDHEHEGVKTAP